MRKRGIICGALALFFCCGIRAGAQQLAPEEEMIRAVEFCAFGKVRTLGLRRPELLRARDRVGRTLLHLAARCQDVALARFLIERQADINALDSDGRTPLHHAAAADNLALAKLLVASHAQVNMTDKLGLTPLFQSKAGIARVLLENGADPYVEDKEGQTVLHYRAEKEQIRLLMVRGLDVNVKDYKGRTPLHSAVRRGTRACQENPLFVNSASGLEDVRALLASGADLNARDAEGALPQMMLGDQYEQMLRLLLSKGADINAQDSRGNGVIHLVTREYFAPPVPQTDDRPASTPPCVPGTDALRKLEFLLSRGADPNLRNHEGLTALGLVSKTVDGERSVRAARLLLSHKADQGTTDELGNTLLHLAAAAGNSELVEFLLKERGVEPSPKNAFGETPLHLVADVETAALLLRYKADLQHRDHQYEAPMYKAVAAGRVEIVRLLLKAGAGTFFGNLAGETLLHVAARNGDVPVMELLVKAGMKIDLGSPRLRRPLHEAASSTRPGALEAIKFLLARGAEVNLRDKTNSTALHEVVSKEPSATIVEQVRILLEHGADANLKNAYGHTALELAREQRRRRANWYSPDKDEKEKVEAQVKRLEVVVAVLEKIPVVIVPERRIFGKVMMPDGTPIEAFIVVGDADEPATKIWVKAEKGKFEFKLGEGHRFHYLAYFDTEKDGAPVRIYALGMTQTVKGDMGPIEIILNKVARRQ